VPHSLGRMKVGAQAILLVHRVEASHHQNTAA